MSPTFAAGLRAVILLHSDVILPTRKSVRRALMKCDGQPELLRQLLDLKRWALAGVRRLSWQGSRGSS